MNEGTVVICGTCQLCLQSGDKTDFFVNSSENLLSSTTQMDPILFYFISFDLCIYAVKYTE